MAKLYQLEVKYNNNSLLLRTYDKDKIDKEVTELLDDTRLESIDLRVEKEP